jgi:release factor-specific protein-(glutamine-N5) methyltransferase
MSNTNSARKEKTSANACKKNYTNIGGQAVIEGVMMRGATSMATAVRAPSGEITLETSRINKNQSAWKKVPFVRGVVNFGSQLFAGTALLMRSAEVYGDFAEPSKFDNFVAKKFKVNPLNLVLGFSVFLGVAVAIALFVFLPNFLAGLIFSAPALAGAHPLLYSLLEGLLMLLIFILYILAVSAMKDIRRVFMYHGAEHKVISCYENNLELNVQNAQSMSTAHPRCGTTFMFFVLAVSILVFSLINWALSALGWQTQSSLLNSLIKLPAKLLFVPVIAGISYELLKLLAKYDNLFVRILRAPGMLLQKLTTKQPTDDMVECSLAAFKEVLALEADQDRPLKKFDIKVPYQIARMRVEKELPNADASDIDWLFVEATGKKRSEIPAIGVLSAKENQRLEELAQVLADGKPLQYALGYAEFYGLRLKVDQSTLIPRPETETLAELAINSVKERQAASADKEQKITVLDLCAGSGAIAIAIAKNADAKVTACDISENALVVARENADAQGADIEFYSGDLFGAVEGKKFDIIVSNPPYVKSGDIEKLDSKIRNFEPLSALDGGSDGLDFYRKIAQDAKAYLEKGGVLLLEMGAEQANDIKAIFADYKSVVIKKDLSGLDRIAVILP